MHLTATQNWVVYTLYIATFSIVMCHLGLWKTAIQESKVKNAIIRLAIYAVLH